MTTDRDLDEILAEIGREHRTIDAPQSLGATLRAETSRQKDLIGQRTLAFGWVAAIAALLLAVIAIAEVWWQLGNSHPRQEYQVRSLPAPQVAPEQRTRSPHVAEHRNAALSAGPHNSKSRVNRTRFDHLSTVRTSAYSLDEFVPLPVSEGLPPAAELSVVRINLRGSDLRQYGLDAPADAVAQTLSAELVVGEDGLPRAIRIVQ